MAPYGDSAIWRNVKWRNMAPYKNGAINIFNNILKKFLKTYRHMAPRDGAIWRYLLAPYDAI